MLVLSMVLQSTGFYALAAADSDFTIPRISARVCASGAVTQSVGWPGAAVLGAGPLWLLGILG